MWRDERLHRSISTLDTKDNLKVLRNFIPKKSIVEDVVTYGFIPQDVEEGLINKTRDFLKLENPISAQTSNFLIKLGEPCTELFSGRRVIFKDQGEFKIDEVIDDKNFTVHLNEKRLPERIQLTHKEVYNMKSFDKDIVTTMTVSALQEVDKEVQTLKGSILDESRLKTLNVRISLLENVLASISVRIDKLEKL
jgi:hypothetical protein